MAINHTQKSIVDQIIDVTIEKLERSEKYTQQTIDELRKIVKAGNLNRREPIVEVLEAQMEEFHETT